MQRNFPERAAPTSSSAHRAVIDALDVSTHGIYLGHDASGWRRAGTQQSVMVLGPPRSGKTTSLIVPNILGSAGPVVSTSTKTDVLDATIQTRAATGRCYVFDPTGAVELHGGAEPLRWSPLQSSSSWTGAQTMAATLVAVGTAGGATGGGVHGEGAHWHERAGSLLAPLLFAAALSGEELRTVVTWVDRRQALPAQRILAGEGGGHTELARNLLDGIVATDERELSGIWSTASGALGGCRSEAALAATSRAAFDPARFVRSSDTIYLAAPAHRQALVAPLVVGLLNDIRFATYEAHADRSGASGRALLFALDELANIAPIPDLPSVISEGGGQGLLTLACFQDLSQARNRWPGHADGFPSLFGTTVVLAGIGDVRTLESVSVLAGEEEIGTRSRSIGRTATDRPFADLIAGGRPSITDAVATRSRRRLPPDLIARGMPGRALALDERNRAGWVPLAPYYLAEPWRSLFDLGAGPELGRLEPGATTGPTLDLGR